MSTHVGAVLVIGGGIGGMQSALDLADSGFKVYLLDSSPSIGGTMAQLDKTFPTNDCSMCIMSPKLVDVGRHPNIELLTLAELDTVKGKEGDFTVEITKKARYVDLEKCTGCGVCAQHCPIDAISTFNEGLSKRKAIYVKYPQAVPLSYTIDRDKCIGCGLCENLCLADAICYDAHDDKIQVHVGSIIVSPGFEEFDPKLKSEYGYGRYSNVITSIEFERVLSASGPFKGRVMRPSDGKIPKKVAFIQCVGSRDKSCGNNYCSSVCCTYAIKEAVIAKEHNAQVQPTIFYMDMRTFGKGFEEYYTRAEDEHGIKFIRCRIPEIQQKNSNKNLILRYESEEGSYHEEEFDLVVLSVGFQPNTTIEKLSKKLGIKLNKFGFCEVTEFTPINTSRPGVYVCGAFSGPKDIPETVMGASGASAKSTEFISQERNSLASHKKYPEERDVSDEEPRIGVFICHCGINIGAYVDVPAVVDYAQTLPNVTYAEQNLYTCSQDTQQKIVEKIKEHKLNRVIVASCTPRTHEPLFQDTIRQAGLNPHLFEMANIRDQCSWVHMNQPQPATQKAKDLVRMAVSKARLIEPLPSITLDVTQNAVVIGGGISGMTSALAIANQGYPVYLIEKEPQIGGNASHIYWTAKHADVQQYLKHLIKQVEEHKKIKILTNATIEKIEGYVGNYTTTVTNHSQTTIKHGVIVVATGAEEYKPKKYLYGEDSKVFTQNEFEQALAKNNRRLSKKTIVMIQCVGSRDDTHPYCSRICCQEALKNSLKTKELYPDAEIYILYRDMRSYGFFETYYEQAREKGIIFIRYEPEQEPLVKKGKDDIEIQVTDLILDEQLTLHADYLVLSPAIIPRKDAVTLAQMLKVPVNENGFYLEAHVKLRPVDFATEGVFVAGMAHSPKNIEESIVQAYAAASRALRIISQDTYRTEAIVAHVNEDLCSGCGICETTCPYGAIERTTKTINGEEKLVSHVTEGLCKGCGSCSSSCPSGAIEQKGFKINQIQAMINSAAE